MPTKKTSKVSPSSRVQPGKKNTSAASSRGRSVPKFRTEPWASFLVSDDLRVEDGGKVTVLGLYADNIVVVKRAPPIVEDTGDIGLDSLAVLISVGGIEGEQPVSFVLEDPAMKKKAKPAPPRATVFTKDRTTNFAIRLRPFITKGYGEKTVRVSIGGLTWEHKFQIVSENDLRGVTSP